MSSFIGRCFPVPEDPSHLEDRIIVFTRYPVPGKTKTRLIPDIGAYGAACLQCRMTRKTLATVAMAAERGGIAVEVGYEGGFREDMRGWLGKGTIYSRQVGVDLGERMAHAFAGAFRAGCRKVVLLGADIPGLNFRHLLDSFSALEESDVVIGPSMDGGYWLIGMKKEECLFKDIGWGTDKVLNDTVRCAEKSGLTVTFADRLIDIDRFRDLEASWPEEAAKRPFFSVIIPVLNEEENIGPLIEDIRDDEVEIIVVDGGSGDNTAAIAEKAGAVVLKGARCRGAQMNSGASVAGGKILVFLHADTLLPAGFKKMIFDALVDSNTVLGAFRFKTDLDHPFMRFIEMCAYIRSRYMGFPYGDQALFLKKTHFERYGGFPEIAIAEDLKFVSFLRKKGKIRTLPACAVTSARRWRSVGLCKTTLINKVIELGIIMGVSPRRLSSLYGFSKTGTSCK